MDLIDLDEDTIDAEVLDSLGVTWTISALLWVLPTHLLCARLLWKCQQSLGMMLVYRGLRAVLDTPPHIPSRSERNGRNPSRSEQIPSGMVGIRAESEWNGRNDLSVRTHPNFTWIPTKFRPDSNQSDQIPSGTIPTSQFRIKL